MRFVSFPLPSCLFHEKDNPGYVLDTGKPPINIIGVTLSSVLVQSGEYSFVFGLKICVVGKFLFYETEIKDADSLLVTVVSTVSLIDSLLDRSRDCPTSEASLFTVIEFASIRSALRYPVTIASAVNPSPVPNQMFNA